MRIPKLVCSTDGVSRWQYRNETSQKQKPEVGHDTPGQRLANRQTDCTVVANSCQFIEGSPSINYRIGAILSNRQIY